MGAFIGGLILREGCQIFGQSFQYHRQLADKTGTNVVLEFSAMVDDIPCQGVDLIEFDSNKPGSKILDFKVMVRPPEAGVRLKQLMGERIVAAMKEMGIELPAG